MWGKKKKDKKATDAKNQDILQTLNNQDIKINELHKNNSNNNIEAEPEPETKTHEDEIFKSESHISDQVFTEAKLEAIAEKQKYPLELVELNNDKTETVFKIIEEQKMFDEPVILNITNNEDIRYESISTIQSNTFPDRQISKRAKSTLTRKPQYLYKLPTTVGYDGHSLTKERRPQYSMLARNFPPFNDIDSLHKRRATSIQNRN